MEDFGDPNFRTLGESACVFELPGAASLAKQRRIWQLHAGLRGLPGMIDSVPGMNNLTLIYDPDRLAASAIERRLSELSSGEESGELQRPRTHVIPARYGGADGPDLEDVCAATGLGAREIVRLHCERAYRVYFIGFQPGFAYLGDLDARIALPRRAAPRARVPRGSVAIAGSMTAIYPFDSPGGWHLIGRTLVAPFDASRSPASLFAPGDVVRFEEMR